MNDFFARSLKIGLDVDEVLADFLTSYAEQTNSPEFVNAKSFNFSYSINKTLAELPEEFWLNIKPKIKASELNFLPTCYITKRNFDKSVTEKWLEKNEFPCMPVYHVTEASKFTACKTAGIDFYLDDHIANFQDLNSKGIKTFLMNASHNATYDVGDMRIYHIRDLIYKISKLSMLY